MFSVKQDRTVDGLGLGMGKLKPREEQETPQQDLGQEGPEQSFSPGEVESPLHTYKEVCTVTRASRKSLLHLTGESIL